MSAPTFDYDQAFARNLGWVTQEEQHALRGKTVALGGMGGVGGHHLLALARLGIGRFRIADLDHFEMPNFNRQAGAAMSTLGAAKVEVMAQMAKDVNPDARIEVFAGGLTPANLDQFLAGADLYVDGLDYFAFDIRSATFAACSRLGVPAVTAAPLGMGVSCLSFMPGKMSFEEYFRWARCSDAERAVRFLVGFAPTLRINYLVDPSRVDFQRGAGPSTPMACYLCAGVAASQALKILLGRGKIRCAPHGVHFDAYRLRMVRSWLPWGNANPLQRLKIAILHRRFSSKSVEEANP
ncbi:ThiF family adenylyltransferase [Lacisediminimonas profundi]|uniref:ThiF family adenylyltransferase n=1 Tax=Lacisediminimonas profundi TaxID=2603856 RepID=UPI001F502E1E|nr:ThiF family adenylyltransferase [Lacisediminimonas profundi]